MFQYKSGYNNIQKFLDICSEVYSKHFGYNLLPNLCNMRNAGVSIVKF